MFLVGAIWNWAIAVGLAAISIIDKDQLEMMYDDIPVNLLYFHILMGLVFALSLVCYWVSIDLNKNLDLIKMGIVAKVLVFIVAIAYFAADDANLAGLGAPIGDSIFAILFLETLVKSE
ncbi:MAG: hypothetical protein ACFFB3_13920 [Candidatus Hodarchaeota archaeon]